MGHKIKAGDTVEYFSVKEDALIKRGYVQEVGTHMDRYFQQEEASPFATISWDPSGEIEKVWLQDNYILVPGTCSSWPNGDYLLRTNIKELPLTTDMPPTKDWSNPWTFTIVPPAGSCSGGQYYGINDDGRVYNINDGINFNNFSVTGVSEGFKWDSDPYYIGGDFTTDYSKQFRKEEHVRRDGHHVVVGNHRPLDPNFTPSHELTAGIPSQEVPNFFNAKNLFRVDNGSQVVEQHSLVNEQTKEKLAEYAHDALSHWMKYMFNKCNNIIYDHSGYIDYILDGDLIIPEVFVKRWKRLMETPYKELSEEEKASDRKEADKILKIIKEK